jgi:hypothetical protein
MASWDIPMMRRSCTLGGACLSVIYLFAGGLRSQDQIRVSDDPIAAAQKIPLAPPVRVPWPW